MTTTIKVPVPVRDRINQDAKMAGISVSKFMTQLLDWHAREQRIAAFGQAMSEAGDDYWQEFHEWDGTLTDGLPSA
jgi:hypothetical protein